MGDFIKGMNSIGQLCPAPSPYSDYPHPASAWKGVADSFKQTGDEIRHAIKVYRCQAGKQAKTIEEK